MINERGMTIVELMIVATILLIILGGAMTFLVFSNRQFSWIETQSKVNQDLRTVIQQMTIDIKEARQVLTAEPNRMIISLPNMDTYGAIPINYYDTITYYPETSVNPVELRMKIDKGPGSRRHGWGKRVSQLSDSSSIWVLCRELVNHSSENTAPLFTYNSETLSLITSCTVTLKVRRHAGLGKYQEGTISTSVRLRNKRT